MKIKIEGKELEISDWRYENYLKEGCVNEMCEDCPIQDMGGNCRIMMTKYYKKNLKSKIYNDFGIAKNIKKYFNQMEKEKLIDMVLENE